MTHFDSLSIEDLREVVEPDRPESMERQAGRWAAIGDFYTGQAALLDDHLTAIRPSWTGSAAERFYFEVERVVDDLQLAAEVAEGNATGWRSITEYVRYARTEIIALHDEWLLVKAEMDGEDDEATLEARRAYDDAARAIMAFTADETTDVYLRELWHPEPFEPIGPDGDDHQAEYTRRSTMITEHRNDTTTWDDRRERSEPKSPTEKESTAENDDRNMIDGHGPHEDRDLIDGHGPEGDEFVTILNGPPYDAVGPDGPPSYREEPILQNPPSVTPVAPQPTPTVPPGPTGPPATGQPVVPPAGFGTPPGLHRGFTPPPPTARHTPFHTPQQNTVRPVIGARPGPAAGIPTVGSASEGLNRPVVGNRPASAKAATPRKLIDGKGVIRSSGNRTPVRGPVVSRSSTRRLPRGAILPQPRRHRAVPIAEDVRNLKRRRSRREHDAFEPETTTVPGIIDGSHIATPIDPGPILNRPPTIREDPDEHATVARLSERPETSPTDQELWCPPTEVSPAVITSRRPDTPTRHDPGTLFPQRSRPHR